MGRGPIAVIDATALIYLIQVGLHDRLALLFDRVLIPDAVRQEYRRGPGRRRRLLRRVLAEQRGFYAWCEEHDEFVFELLREELDPGEAGTLAQADHLGATAIIDERKGAGVAQRMQIPLRRTGGLVLDMKETGLIVEVRPWLDRLRQAGFRLSDDIYAELLERAHEAPDD